MESTHSTCASCGGRVIRLRKSQRVSTLGRRSRGARVCLFLILSIVQVGRFAAITIEIYRQSRAVVCRYNAFMNRSAPRPGRVRPTAGWRGGLVVLALLATLWPGIGVTETNPIEAMMWSMADMIARASAQHSVGAQGGSFNLPGAHGYPSPGLPGANGWMPGSMPGAIPGAMPGNGYWQDWQRPMPTPAQPVTPNTPWPGFTLNGTWQGTGGELLTVAGSRFHLRSGPQRTTSGYLRVLGDQMVFTSDQTGRSQGYRYVRNERRLMLQGPDGQAMIFQRVHRPATQPAPGSWGGPSGYSTYGR